MHAYVGVCVCVCVCVCVLEVCVCVCVRAHSHMYTCVSKHTYASKVKILSDFHTIQIHPTDEKAISLQHLTATSAI